MAFSATQWKVGLVLAVPVVLFSARQVMKNRNEAADAGTVQVLMLSDLHFDPFRDVSKVPKLAAAPTSEWEKILEQPDTEAEKNEKPQHGCALKGPDSSYTLLQSSLSAEKAQSPGVKFVVIGGDLLTHLFDCRYDSVMKDTGGKDGYAAFAEKTASFVIERVEATFPGVPVYVALGNNDSSCGDYKMDVNDRFFAGTSKAAIDGLRGADNAEVKQARADYQSGGYFAVTLPGPMQKTRLLVFDDIFLSNFHTTCAGKADGAGGVAMMAWLKNQLHGAAERGEKVWVMGHIPPGIDVYSTIRKGDICSDSEVVSFMTPAGKDSLGDVLANSGGVIRLGIFGHVHMDEMKLLTSESGGKVPIKGLSSISPVNGNLPSFTVARIDPASAEMSDYTVFAASNKTGIDTTWKREYSFRETYHKPNFSAATLSDLAGGFDADMPGNTEASAAYEQYFDPGARYSPLMLGWHEYACGIDHYTEAGFKACTCAAAAK